MDIKYEIERVLVFKDIFPDEDDFDILSTLKKYSRSDLIHGCTILSNNYGNAYIPDDHQTFFSKHSESHIADLKKRVTSFFQLSGFHRVAYSTTKTALELMRLIFSIQEDEYQKNRMDEDFEINVFKVVLSINQYLLNGPIEETQDIASLVFYCHYVMNDVTGQDYDETRLVQIAHFAQLNKFIKTNAYLTTVSNNFIGKYGFNSLIEFFKSWLWLTEQYKGPNSNGITRFKVNESNVLNTFSLDIHQTIKYSSEDKKDMLGNDDYKIFRSKPLILDDDNCYFTFSQPILNERLYNGLYFDLLNCANNDGNFSRVFKKEFVEEYLFHNYMFDCITKRRTTSSFPTRYTNKKQEVDNQPDFYVREKKNVILFECKAIKLKGLLKDDNNIKSIIADLENKIGKKEGVGQLLFNIKSIINKKFRWDTHIPSDVTFYPVLILEDTHLTVPGIWKIVNDWYKTRLDEVYSNHKCYPIIVMSINTLRTYRHVFHNYGFTQLFDEFFRENVTFHSNNEWIINNQLADFDIHMKEKYKLSHDIKIKMCNETIEALGIKKKIVK